MAVFGFVTLAAATAQETHAPFSLPPWGSSPEDVTTSMGPPGFLAESIRIYGVEIQTEDGSLTADLTLWFLADGLGFASYSFPADDLASPVLLVQFQTISAIISHNLGEPASRTSVEGKFITEVWDTQDAAIEHTVILLPDRRDHAVSFTRP